ncbi:LysE family translocator [Tropicimonas sp.]|uniref:LysE family translocator n=1 Tax=Tropicimonas sp. TaxID=2067044 RepID=UPI003A8A4703
MFEMSLALVAFLFPLAYSPGPGNMFFAANGARFGLAATVPASAGYHAATWAVTAATGFGFAAAADLVPGFLVAIRWLGAGYVFLIAWRFLRAGASAGGPEAAPAGFVDGAMLLLLNPKAYVIIVLLFSQFLTAPGGGAVADVLWITTVFTLNNLVAFTVWTVIGSRLGARFRDAGGARRLNAAFGTILALVALWMLAG